jgi:uncharacterized protein YggE
VAERRAIAGVLADQLANDRRASLMRISLPPSLARSSAMQAPALAQESNRLPELSANGEGIVIAKPDIATVSIGVVSEASTARDALNANSGDMQRVIDSIKTAGVAEKDIGTTGFNIDPVYSRPPLRPDGSQENPQ